jgi:eukaryotic-like serine/threonine-protein kinase
LQEKVGSLYRLHRSGQDSSRERETKCIVAEPALGGLREALPTLSTSELVAERYRPLRPLGSGGSGSVWLARDEQTGLDVALKIVAREGKAATRAEREALAAARLRHERCLRAYGLERDSRNVYIAYEYVPGQTMREALRAGELKDDAAVETAAQVLEGLAHAHARGIVHRDVKPHTAVRGCRASAAQA